MSNNTTNYYDELVLSSLHALQSTASASAGLVIVGLVTVLANILEIATIVKTKKLRTRCYFLISNVALASIIFAFSYFATGAKRLLRYDYQIPEVNTKLHCAGEMFTSYFGQSATVFLPLATAIDRVSATWDPIRYKQMSYKFTAFSACFSWALAIADSCFTFYGDDQQSLVANCNLVSSTDALYTSQMSIQMIVSSLVTLSYAMVIFILRKQMKEAKMKSANLAANKMKIQTRVAKTLGVDSAVHLVTQVATRVGLTVLAPLPAASRSVVSPFIRLILIVGCGSSFFIFFIMNKEFKAAFLRTFRRVLPLKWQVVPNSTTAAPSNVPTTYPCENFRRNDSKSVAVGFY